MQFLHRGIKLRFGEFFFNRSNMAEKLGFGASATSLHLGVKYIFYGFWSVTARITLYTKFGKRQSPPIHKIYILIIEIYVHSFYKTDAKSSFNSAFIKQVRTSSWIQLPWRNGLLAHRPCGNLQLPSGPHHQHLPEI